MCLVWMVHMPDLTPLVLDSRTKRQGFQREGENNREEKEGEREIHLRTVQNVFTHFAHLHRRKGNREIER